VSAAAGARGPRRFPSSTRPLPGFARCSLAIVRVASAVVFISFGMGKFVNHASETASFRVYGLPLPGAFTVAIGVLELVGGVLLLVGVKTRLASLLLAGDMVGAIVVSGVLHGETISLTLAPALLLAMIALAVWGPGGAALDERARGRRRE
jgi:putative oxidoreductase